MTPAIPSRGEADLAARQSGCLMRLARGRARGFRSMASQSGLGAHSQQGSSIVEFALVSAILFTLVFGMIAIAWGMYSLNALSEAAREATRYAIVRGSACTSFTTACPAANTDIQSYVQGLGFPGIDSTKLGVTTIWTPTVTGETCTPSATCNNPGNQVQVTVTYPFPLSIPYVRNQTWNMSSTSEMVISQ